MLTLVEFSGDFLGSVGPSSLFLPWERGSMCKLPRSLRMKPKSLLVKFNCNVVLWSYLSLISIILWKKKKELYTIPFSPYPISGHYSLTRNRHYVISLQKALYQRGSHLPFPAQQYKSSIWREVLFIGPGTGSLPRCWLKKKIRNKKYLFCVKKKKQKKLRYLVR